MLIWLYSTASNAIPGIINPRPFIITRGRRPRVINGRSRVMIPGIALEGGIKQLAPDLIIGESFS